jgi:hypothetical protein
MTAFNAWRPGGDHGGRPLTAQGRLRDGRSNATTCERHFRCRPGGWDAEHGDRYAQAAPQSTVAAACSISNTAWQVGSNYHAGWTIAQLAQTYGVSQDQIRAWITAYNNWVGCTLG